MTETKTPREEALKLAIGGSYELSDGRKFWLDELAVQEIVKRIRAALSEPEAVEGLDEAIEAAEFSLFEGDPWPIMRSGELETLVKAVKDFRDGKRMA